jgi:uncharacterized protein
VDPFRGFGTAVNVVTVLVGSGIGIVLGHRLTQRTRDTVTDALGLVTLMIATLAAAAVTSPTLTSAVGDSAPVLIVLGSMLVGGLIGSWLRIEAGLESVGDLLQRRLASSDQTEQRRRFVEGFVSSSLVFCVGPLTILGSLNDGLGNGSDQLMLKSALDGFASIAFAAAFGWGVAAAAISVLVVQGGLTGVGALLGQLLPDPQLAALTATGGLLLAGVGLRLLQIKAVPVGDLLPALLVAPLLTELVIAIR